jgi:hypothetical protein
MEESTNRKVVMIINLDEVTLFGTRYQMDRNWVCRCLYDDKTLEEVRSLWCSDIDFPPYKVDLELGKMYDIVWDWRHLDDGGYMTVYIVDDRWMGERMVECRDRVYSSIIDTHFQKVEDWEVRDGVLNTLGI